MYQESAAVNLLQNATPNASIDAAIAATCEDVRPHRWSRGLQFGFRVAFCYFLTYTACIGNATFWEVIPVAGDYISRWMALPFRLFGQYLAQHVIYLQGVGATLHGGGSGDTAIDWIVSGEMLTLAMVGAMVWTALDRRRRHYQTLAAWLRFFIRLALGMGMVGYGLAKVFPMQMQPPMLPVLNEPLGNTSPMTMLWTLLGLNPYYEMVCGGAELLAGLLILFRRTALAGALLTAFVVTNVVLYNFFFDVPVKLYASNLLLMSVFVILPDIRPLFQFFWKHEPAAPSGVWVPPASRPGFRRATAIVEIAFLTLCVGTNVYGTGSFWRAELKAQQAPIAWRGGWRMDSATVQGRPQPLLVGVDQPVTEFYAENSMFGHLRSSGGELWRASMKYDDAKRTLEMHATGSKGATYLVAMPDYDHLKLAPIGKGADKQSTLDFTRIPLATSYPLLNRGFHFVNEWGLER